MTTSLPGETKYALLLQLTQVGLFKLRNRVKSTMRSISNFDESESSVSI